MAEKALSLTSIYGILMLVMNVHYLAYKDNKTEKTAELKTAKCMEALQSESGV